jgi:hypothetical protein
LTLLTRTRILRNLWGIYKNAQIGLDLILNQLSNELFFAQNRAISKKTWWFWSSCSLVFMSNFHIFYIKMCYNLYHGTSELAELWDLGYLIVFLSIYMVRFPKRSKFEQLRNKSSNLGQWLCWNCQSNLGPRKYLVAIGKEDILHVNTNGINAQIL